MLSKSVCSVFYFFLFIIIFFPFFGGVSLFSGSRFLFHVKNDATDCLGERVTLWLTS